MEIKIEIEDHKIFAFLAFILDQKSFISKVEELRKCWRIEKELIPYEKFQGWLDKPRTDFLLSADVYDLIEKIEEDNNFGDPYLRGLIDTQKIDDIVNLDPLSLELEYLIRKNGIHIRFKQLVLKAIVCGKVNLSDWNEANKNKLYFEHKDWIINISRFETIYLGSTKVRKNIFRDREWYWERERGKEPLQISLKTKYRKKWQNAITFADKVKHAIYRYEDFLEQKGTQKYN